MGADEQEPSEVIEGELRMASRMDMKPADSLASARHADGTRATYQTPYKTRRVSNAMAVDGEMSVERILKLERRKCDLEAGRWTARSSAMTRQVQHSI